jgi:hypothetical protein
MHHYVAKSDGLGEGCGNLVVEIVVDVAIQVELALLHQLHYRGPCEELGDRPGTKKRSVDGDRGLLLDIGISVAFGEENSAILDDGDDDASDVVGGQLLRHDAVQKGTDVIGGERVGAGAGRLHHGSGRRLRRDWIGLWLLAPGQPIEEQT